MIVFSVNLFQPFFTKMIDPMPLKKIRQAKHFSNVTQRGQFFPSLKFLGSLNAHLYTLTQKDQQILDKN
jgi:hypothetical protein